MLLHLLTLALILFLTRERREVIVETRPGVELVEKRVEPRMLTVNPGETVTLLHVQGVGYASSGMIAFGGDGDSRFTVRVETDGSASVFPANERYALFIAFERYAKIDLLNQTSDIVTGQSPSVYFIGLVYK